MPVVKPVEVVVPAKGGISVTDLPVARRCHAVEQRSVVQHGKVEPTSIPGDKHRRVSLQPIEEPPDKLRLRRCGGAQRPDLDPLRGAEDRRNCHDVLQMMAQEIRAGRLTLLLEHDLGHMPITESFQAMYPAPVLDVRNRLDVEYEHIPNGHP